MARVVVARSDHSGNRIRSGMLADVVGGRGLQQSTLRSECNGNDQVRF